MDVSSGSTREQCGGEGRRPGRGADEDESIDIPRVQLLLAEKRTSLAALRTGIAIFTLPLSVTTVLVTTSRFYNFLDNLHFLIPLFFACALLVGVGSYLILVSLVRHRRQNEQIRKIKMRHDAWRDLLEG
jgi:uncharacterized membrane protein YidH (DUF202 family)